MRKLKKCSKCNKNAVIFQNNSGLYLCKSCFIKYVERKIRRTITRFNLIKKDDKLCIGVSWGKDSMTMLYNLYQRQSRIMGAKKIVAINIDEGITGYREKNTDILRKFLKDFNIDVELIELSFKRDFGLSLDEMISIIKEKNMQLNACTICGTIRRRLLNDAAKNIGASKLAIGHNLDDTVQTLLLNILRNDVLKIGKDPPEISGFEPNQEIEENFVHRIKPLIDLTEKETSAYAYYKGFPLQSNPCPYSRTDPILRRQVQIFLNSFDEKSPEIKYNLLNANYQLFEMINPFVSKSLKYIFKKCDICQQPAGPTRNVCLFCEFKKKFGLI